MYDNFSFGSWLKRRRKELDLTREELADHVGCSPIMIYKIESGERRPSKQIASLLAHELKIPPSEHETFIKFVRQSDAAAVTHKVAIKGITPLITHLIGREADLIKIEDMLFIDHQRLITLVGIPGVGKTSVATQILQNVADRFDDESYFIPLVSIRDPDVVASTIAQNIGLQEVTGHSPTEQLKHFFANRVSLLVLDNFEHLLKSRTLVTELIEACPRLHIIITTRAALKLPNEKTFRIKTLRIPDPKYPIHLSRLIEYSSVDLFVHYAQASQPSFTLTQENASAVAQICARLEGIPLAIVLAAARIKTFSPESLFQHLNKRLSSVTAAPASNRGTHQTLRDAVIWSYDLLTPNQKQLFAKLAVFINGSTFEAIEKVCADRDDDILNTLEALTDQNLVQDTQDSAEQNRFSMLETVREYALEKLDEVSAYEVGNLRRMHAEYFLSIAEQAEPFLRSKDQLIWLARLTADQENFEAALEWSLENDSEINLRLAGALGWYWYITARIQRGSYWLKLATRDVQNAPLRFRANALIYSMAIGTINGDFQWAFDAGEEAVRLFRILQDDRMLGQALLGSITPHLILGYQDKLEALASEGIALAQRTNDTYALAFYGFQAAVMESDIDVKLNIIEKYLPDIRQTGERWLLNITLLEIGHTYIHIGNYPRAKTILEECLKSCKELADIRITGWVLGALGETQFYLGDSALAAKMIVEGLEISRSINDIEGGAIRLTQLAAVFHALGHSESAIHLLSNVSNLNNGTGQVAREMHVARYDKVLKQVSDELDKNSFTAAWNAGKIMKFEQIIEYALSYAMFVTNLL